MWVTLDPDEIGDVGKVLIDAGDEFAALRSRLLGLSGASGLGSAAGRAQDGLGTQAEAIRLLGVIYALLGLDIVTRALRLLEGESLASAVSTSSAGVAGGQGWVATGPLVGGFLITAGTTTSAPVGEMIIGGAPSWSPSSQSSGGMTIGGTGTWSPSSQSSGGMTIGGPGSWLARETMSDGAFGGSVGGTNPIDRLLAARRDREAAALDQLRRAAGSGPTPDLGAQMLANANTNALQGLLDRSQIRMGADSFIAGIGQFQAADAIDGRGRVRNLEQQERSSQ